MRKTKWRTLLKIKRAGMYLCFAIPAFFFLMAYFGLKPYKWVLMICLGCTFLWCMLLLGGFLYDMRFEASAGGTAFAITLLLAAVLLFALAFLWVGLFYPSVAYTTTIGGEKLVVYHSWPGGNPQYHAYTNPFWIGEPVSLF